MVTIDLSQDRCLLFYSLYTLILFYTNEHKAVSDICAVYSVGCTLHRPYSLAFLTTGKMYQCQQHVILKQCHSHNHAVVTNISIAVIPQAIATVVIFKLTA